MTTIKKYGRIELKQFVSKGGVTQYRIYMDGLLQTTLTDHVLAKKEFNKFVRTVELAKIGLPSVLPEMKTKTFNLMLNGEKIGEIKITDKEIIENGANGFLSEIFEPWNDNEYAGDADVRIIETIPQD